MSVEDNAIDLASRLLYVAGEGDDRKVLAIAESICGTCLARITGNDAAAAEWYARTSDLVLDIIGRERFAAPPITVDELRDMSIGGLDAEPDDPRTWCALCNALEADTDTQDRLLHRLGLASVSELRAVICARLRDRAESLILAALRLVSDGGRDDG